MTEQKRSGAPGARATAIMNGLLASGRATSFILLPDHVRLRPREGGGFYFLTLDGAELSRGTNLRHAEALQAGFTEAMARLGREQSVVHAPIARHEPPGAAAARPAMPSFLVRSERPA